MTKFKVTRDGNTVEDAVYDVDPVVDTANPFGDYCVIKLDDRGGNKFAQYERGTRIDVEIIDESGTAFDRFTGYVVERRENEQAGADALEVEAYSFDQFLRRNTVTNDQRGNTITQALADIIQTDTPVTYEPANVDVGDDQELTRSYQGEAVENVLRDFAFKSNNEEFGVNDDLEFFFRPRETEHIDRGIDNTQWFRYDIPELGKEAINEVEVWFDDGEESVIVDDGTDKLDLQDNLGLPSPGTQRAELNRPLVTDIADAEDIGRKYLKFRNSTLSGTVTTFGLYDAEPGDTIDITIDARGIDSEFVIAGVEYRWGVDETILTIIERRGDVDDILTDLNDSVQRVEMEGANRDAPSNRITTTNATALVDVSVDAGGTTPDAVRFVNDGRRAVRDTWTGDAPPDITTLLGGDDGTGLSRSNDALRNQTGSVSVTQTLPDATSVEFSADVQSTGFEELGLETADGQLIMRAVFSPAVELGGPFSTEEVTITLTVSNDASVSRGVLTNDGQTAVRDVLADNSPALPDAYAYGSDGTAVSESDIALGNQLTEVSLTRVLIQQARSESDWSAITTIPDTQPLTISGEVLKNVQAAWTTDSDEFTITNTNLQQSGDLSGGEAESIPDDTASIDISFDVNYRVPGDEFALFVRLETLDTSAPGLQVSFNGETWQPVIDGASFGTLGWRDLTDTFGGGNTSPYSGADIEPGSYTLTISGTSAESGQQVIDVIAPLDNRFEFTLDNDNGGNDGYLDGPELYPDVVETDIRKITTRRDITNAEIDSFWCNGGSPHTENKQFVELSNDGQNYTRGDNTQSLEVTFSEPSSEIYPRVGLSRWSDGTSQTPLNGNRGHRIDASCVAIPGGGDISPWSVFGNPNAVVSDDIGEALSRGIVPPGTLSSGTTVREAGLKNDGSDLLLTHHELAEFDVLADQRIASAETTQFTGDN